MGAPHPEYICMGANRAALQLHLAPKKSAPMPARRVPVTYRGNN